ncbi:MAG: MipA/OmpV family protein [Stenotrophobium sp.]
MLCGICVMWSSAAFAQTPSPLAEWQYAGGVALEPYFETAVPVWQVQLGAGAGVQPRYEGSARYHAQPEPLIEIRYRDIGFFSLGEGLGVNFLSRKGLRAGAALSYDLGRREELDPRLHGLGNISPAPELKFFGEYVLYPVVLRADVRRAFGGHSGLIGDLSVYLPLLGSEKFFVLAGPTVTLVNNEYAQRYFGITPAQSAASGLPVYGAAGGIKDVSLGITAAWLFGEHWSVDGIAATERMLGDASRSPLVETPLQYTLSVYLAYSF